MSEKRLVPTFQLWLIRPNEHAEVSTYHGPIVSPNRLEVATNLSEVHDICFRFQGCLIYDRKWHLLNWTHIIEVTKGSNRFPLPWPLEDPADSDEASRS